MTDVSGADARAPLPQCQDNIDNDGDGRIDFPFDPGCSNLTDTAEVNSPPLPECADGLEHDGDGRIDFPADPGCVSAADDNEDNSTLPRCANTLDDDGDGRRDFVMFETFLPDLGCSWAAETSEVDTQCSDGVDNDGDGKIDLADPGCSSASDDDETDQVAYPLPPGGLGTTAPATSGAGTAIAASPSSPRVTRLLTPFPIVRLRGWVVGGLIRVSLLSVRAPAGSKVTVYCSGVGCPVRRVAINVGTKLVRVRRFEKRLRGGAILKIYVTKPGFVGKYTRFRFLSNRAPLRVDRCATKPGIKPKRCPSS